jgi:hypothetical protein
LGTKSWRAQISDRLRLEALIRTNKGEVVEIAMQLLGEIEGEWVQLVRYDNAHGTCHRHTAHPDGTESSHQFVAVLTETFLDEAQRELQKHAEEYLDEYERELSNTNRGMR